MNSVYLGKTIEAGEQLVQDVDQFRCWIRRRNGSETHNVGKKDATDTDKRNQ